MFIIFSGKHLVSVGCVKSSPLNSCSLRCSGDTMELKSLQHSCYVTHIMVNFGLFLGKDEVSFFHDSGKVTARNRECWLDIEANMVVDVLLLGHSKLLKKLSFNLLGKYNQTDYIDAIGTYILCIVGL
ncbi:hypothetical protein L1049_026945 [Liquidambar formosana]|uniref:Uncharacterized protein n=1 Tax=Liquidambar formosana TaxID=63359 RepID=A0AAP0NGF0_LIQFO